LELLRPSALFDYDKILDIFTTKRFIPTNAENFITCDVARKGKDKTIVFVWREWSIVKIYINPVVRDGIFQRATDNVTFTDEVRDALMIIAQEHQVPHSNIIIDEDGIGGGVLDGLDNANGFINNSTPVETEYSKKIHDYRNLKTQCYYKLAELVKLGQIACYDDIPMEAKEGIIQDLEQIKAKTATGSNGEVLHEGKLDIISKKELYDAMGRSPDYSDAMMMRCYFDLNDYYTPHIA